MVSMSKVTLTVNFKKLIEAVEKEKKDYLIEALVEASKVATAGGDAMLAKFKEIVGNRLSDSLTFDDSRSDFFKKSVFER